MWTSDLVLQWLGRHWPVTPFWQIKARALHIAAIGGMTALTVCGLMVVLIGAPSDAAIDQHRADLIARQTRGDLSDAGLRAVLAHMDPAAAALASRFDPKRPRQANPVVAMGPPDPQMVNLLPALNARQAQIVNAGFALSDEPNPPARPFFLKGASGQDRARAIGCLTQAVYYEAGFEPIEGAQAVAQVVLNRVRHPAFPKTVCGVVFEGSTQRTGCQFSFTCDGSLARPPEPAAWKRAQAVAERALNGFVMTTVGGATHYHTQWIVPYWAPTLTKVSQAGSQIFYRWPGDWGLPGAFRGRYAGGENPGVDVGGDPLSAPGSPVKAEPPPSLPTEVALSEPAPIPVVAAVVSGPLSDLSSAAPVLTPTRADESGRAAFSGLH